jgi:GNAT superfamily N-acetyltransferase
MLVVREATPADVSVILQMIRELADYEKQLDQVDTTTADLLRDGFGDNPKFRAFMADWNGMPAGYVVYFFNYSTWAGRPGLYVEDLYVRESFRRKGIAKALLQRVAAIARKHNCYGMRWDVLHWNTPAIDFYTSLGAALHKEWFPVLFMGAALDEFTQKTKRD